MSVNIINKEKRIIELVWSGLVKPEKVEEVNRILYQYAAQLGFDFDLLVDMREVKAFPQDTKMKIVEHQRLLKSWGMKRASVAVGGAVAKMQLNRVAKESEHSTETQWATYEEAYQFLLQPPQQSATA
ncbi:hypothetical protein [Paenibacillus sp. YYML68]|uniref:hypothetical protein n=1 Tax=Paenibacillus sp. YYML68 TaxID=2909250 RepID=UPI002492920F|nr:hypothetical protein [Paenibacillus sp. YYML68]